MIIHHGIQLSDYVYRDRKDDYVCFLGRMAPVKAPHLAIEAARRAGVRIKLAGEIQPVFRRYWDVAGRAAGQRAGCRVHRRSRSAEQERSAVECAGAAVSHPVGRTVRSGDGRSHGVRDAGPGLPHRLGAGGDRRRRQRQDLRRSSTTWRGGRAIHRSIRSTAGGTSSGTSHST